MNAERSQNVFLPLTRLRSQAYGQLTVTKRARALSATVSDTIISILNDSSWSCAEPDSLKMLCDAIIDHDYKGPIDTVEFQGSPGDHERELVIAWEAVPRTCRVRPLAAHAAHFWIRADVEHRVIALALFLLWFRHVYGAHPRVNGFGVDRVGFIILNHGIAGVILCDHTIDPSSGIRFYGMGPPRAICVGRRVYNACSADQDVSETDLNSSVKFMTTYSKILGYQRAEPIRTVEEQVLTDFTANRFDVHLAYLMETFNGTILPVSAGGDILRALRRMDPSPCHYAENVGCLAQVITGHQVSGGSRQPVLPVVDLFGPPQEGDLLLAWRNIPTVGHWRPLSANVGTFYIRTTTSNRPLTLASFLLWFRRVYCTRVPAHREGIVRITFRFVDHGITGALYCDDAVDTSMSLRGHGLYDARVVELGGRLYVTASSSPKSSNEQLATWLCFARRMLAETHVTSRTKISTR
ncbi:hypothetical protein CONPUDRAFT_164621, partial [Coniophora puteana RWD-64-598 SS2]